MTRIHVARLSGLAFGLALATQAATAQQTAPGMTIYIDPRTGAILSQPAPGTQPLTLSPSDQAAMSTSHDGLVETPSSEPGGGVKLDLQGRYQSSLSAYVGPDGKNRTQHLTEPPGHDHQ